MPSLPSPAHPFVGRTDILKVLIDHSIAGDEPSATVLGGDAGVGKTRLIGELTAAATASGGTVLIGHCLDLGESSAPYLPISEMLRRLVRDRPDEAHSVQSARPLLAPLLRSGTATALTDDILARQDPGAFFESLHTYLEELAGAGRLLVVVEDAHWADRSTRDLLTYLFTIDFRAPVSVIVTYRSDDLFRKHPLRRKLAEWTRLPRVRRMTLEPLTDDEVTDLVQSQSHDLATVDVGRIVERSAGNPFFAEELLAVADLDEAGIPEQLADLLLLRVEALDDDARAVVRAASAAGQFISHDLLRSIVDLDDAALDRSLRTIIEHHIFQTTSSGGYAFRHALLAEAVVDDLLPGERIRLHQRYAEAWRGSSAPGAAAALAAHARNAGMTELALSASISAGDEAMAASGPADAAQHYENALALMAEAPDAPSPVEPAMLALRAGDALMTAGDPHRAVDVLRAAHDDLPAGPHHRAKLAAGLVEAQLMADTPGISLSALDASITALEEQPPTKTLALLYAVQARALLSERELDGSALAATEALRLARELEIPRLVNNAATTLARLDDLAGDVDASRARLRDVAEQARRSHDVAAEIRALHQLAVVMARADQPDEAARLLAEAVDRAVEQDFPTGPFALEARPLSAYYSVLVGEWDRADRLLRLDGLRIPDMALAMMNVVRATLTYRRGDGDTAWEAARRLKPLWSVDMFTAIHSGSLCIAVPGERGDVAAALAAYDELVAAMHMSFRLKAFDAQIRFAAELTGFLASVSAAQRSRPDGATDRVSRLVDDAERVVGMRRSSMSMGLESQAWLAMLHAERARFEWCGRGAPPAESLTRTADAVTMFDSLGYRYDAAHARTRLAELLAASGDNRRAREVADVALADARTLGAKGLARSLMSRTARTESRSGRLTPRERDVLRLLAEGRTNGEIASALFITTKTASVHVSNILGKLGASTRTEAAALATKDPSLLGQSPPTGG